MKNFFDSSFLLIHRSTTSGLLTLYVAKLTYWFHEFFCRFLWIFYINNMFSVNRDSWAFSFFNLYTFYFYCLITMATYYNTRLDGSGEGGQPCNIPQLRRETRSSSSLNMPFIVFLVSGRCPLLGQRCSLLLLMSRDHLTWTSIEFC